MSEHELPRNVELEPDSIEHLDDAHLRYQPEAKDATFNPFAPLVVETYPDGRPKKGVCGRDAHGNPVIPPELQGIAIIEVPVGYDLNNPVIHQHLVDIGKTSWPLFVNPPKEVLAERDDWRDEGSE